MLAFFSVGVKAQITSSAPCSLAAPSFATSAPNIFNDRQEQDLGDALAESVEAELHLAPSSADDQLTRIGEKLLATLPPTGIRYRFRIYDSGEVNGFSLAGGRVYISRKLIAAVQNEDELAGVLAHEIGHLATHQSAIGMTRSLRIRLGVTQVGDRADIFAKVHQLFSTPAKLQEDRFDENKDEIVADHVAIYALIRAGYAPQSFPDFFDKVSMNKGKTGNWFTDFLSLTQEDSQRFRAARKYIATLPAECRASQPEASEAFKSWMHGVLEDRVKIAAVGKVDDRPLKLEDPLRPGLWNIRFSPNGRYVLAQDEESISVVDKDETRVLFRIDAPDVQEAQFTPDSSEVVFHDSNLRVERWNVASGKRTAVHELVVYDGCNQTLLAPDARTLVCININVHSDSPRMSLRLIDVESGKPYFENPSFYQFRSLSSYYMAVRFELEIIEGAEFADLRVSPDGRYLFVVADNTSFGYDLVSRQPVPLGKKFKDLTETHICFLAPDKILVTGSPKSFKSPTMPAQVLSFPDGKVLNETELAGEHFWPVTKNGLLRVWPLKDYAVGILDPLQKKIVMAWKLPAIDVWENSVAVESISGGLQIQEIGKDDSTRIPLPLGPLPELRAAAVAPDGMYLAASVRTRGEIWDLQTGKKLKVTRPFRSAWMDDGDNLFAQFPQVYELDPMEVKTSLIPLQSKILGKYEGQDWQYRDLQYRFNPLDKGKFTSTHATLQVTRMETPKLVWSRDFSDETPAVWRADNDRMVLAWDLSCFQAKTEIKKYPQLLRQAETLKNHKKGLLIETINAQTGEPNQLVVIPEIDLTRGWNDERWAIVSGDVVLAHGEHGNTVIYRMEDGAKVGEFFGFAIATDVNADIVVAVNREDEILLVNEHDGKELQRFSLGSPVRLARVVGGEKKELLVLTADQVIHRIPMP
jgi:hypothetical protein